MAGDHCDIPAVERTQLRRQARRVQRVEERGPPWLNAEPIWMVAPHLPKWLRQARKVKQLTPGCYRVEPSWSPFLWIAANDLPLRDDLIPFLVARSGKALDEFARWAATRRPLDWMLNMVQCTAMSPNVAKDLLYGFEETDDPKAEERRKLVLKYLLGAKYDLKDQLIEEGLKKGFRRGRLVQQRDALRQVLAGRRIALKPDDDARIESCSSLATLKRWVNQALHAKTASEALR